MVVDNFDFAGPFGCPNETNSPLIVDPNTVLALSIPSYGLKLVTRRYFKIFESASKV
jgi:hypothetical protein